MVSVRKQPRRPKGHIDNQLLLTFVVSAFLAAVAIVVLSSGNPDDETDSFSSLWSEASSEENVDLLLTEKLKTPFAPYHLVFSTGCSVFQDWQSYVFFYHVIKSGQEGHITRIVSGCKNKDVRKLKRVWEEEILPMAPERLHLHFTPEYRKSQPGKNYKYFNKPKGMQHWMRTAMGYPENHAMHDDSIVILLDPDQILIRPFTTDFTNSSERWRLKEERVKLKVEHGSPFAQQYGFGIQWKRKVDPEYVFQGKTNITDMETKEAYDYYTGMGPPYIATAKDMFAIVDEWADAVVRVHDQFPHLLAEMFGYNLAAAHLGLRHTIAHSFMVSDVFAGGEGWKLIEAAETDDVCHDFPKSLYPHVIHYCHSYAIGKWFVGKYRLRKDFISCESPLLAVPPTSIRKYSRTILPDNRVKDYDAKHTRMEIFMLCVMIQSLNEAAVYFKDQHCTKENANYEYTYTFHEDMSMPEDDKK